MAGTLSHTVSAPSEEGLETEAVYPSNQPYPGDDGVPIKTLDTKAWVSVPAWQCSMLSSDISSRKVKLAMTEWEETRSSEFGTFLDFALDTSLLVVQSLSCVRLFATHGLQHDRLPCPSLSPGVCSNSCPLIWWS